MAMASGFIRFTLERVKKRVIRDMREGFQDLIWYQTRAEQPIRHGLWAQDLCRKALWLQIRVPTVGPALWTPQSRRQGRVVAKQPKGGAHRAVLEPTAVHFPLAKFRPLKQRLNLNHADSRRSKACRYL